MMLFRKPFTYLTLLGASLFLISSPILAQDKKAEKKAVPSKPAAKAVAKKPAPKPAPKPVAKPAVKKPTPKPVVKEKKVVKPIAKKEVVATVKTHTVKAGEFEVSVELAGIVGSKKSTEITLSPKAWLSLSVIKAAKHGAVVKKGDIILQLDTEKLEKAIKAKREAMPLAEITLHAAERELGVAEKTIPMDLENGRRAKMEAEENLAYYEDIQLPMQIRTEKETVQSTKNFLAYAAEELKQLKKMYANDDVTEETEEIILLRAQNTVNSYTWSLEKAETRMKRSLETVIPRDHHNRKRVVERQQISWRSGERTLREGLEKKKLETEQAHRNHKKTMESLHDLEKDLKIMTVRAPHDGIVYLGMNQRGKWITASLIERKLIPGGKLMPKEIVMTVASMKDLQLHVSVAESQLKNLAKGQKGTATMKWNSDIKLDTTVESVSYIPNSANTYDAIFSLKKGKNKLPVVPQMNAATKIKVHENKKALTVPKAAVKTENDKSFVTLKGGKKREVKTGLSNKTLTEILSGLKEGDVIELPKASASASTTVKKTLSKILSTKK